MKILSLTAENVKRLTAVHITPTGALIPISGKNGAGKSTVLDAIWYALGGAKNLAEVPLRKGAKRAMIRLKLGGDTTRKPNEPTELIVERKITTDGSTLVVSTPEGARFTSPQGVLDGLLGALTFDPLAFAAAAPKEQYEILRLMVQLDVDPDVLDGQNRADYDRRTWFNNRAATLSSAAEQIELPDLQGEPEDHPNPTTLAAEIFRASEANVARERENNLRKELARTHDSWRQTAADWRTEAVKLRERAQQLETAADQKEAIVTRDAKELIERPPLPDPINVAELQLKHDLAIKIQGYFARREEKNRLLKEATAAQASANELTERINARVAEKRAAIERAKMPVEGLGFGDGVVTFNGLPFSQAATAEQLRVSLAVAAAANPRLRVLLVRRGNDLDADNLALVAAWAEAEGFQVWLERVSGAGPSTVEITDGAFPALGEEASS